MEDNELNKLRTEDDLLLDKDFDALSTSEKEIIRTGIGEREYRRLREVVTRSAALLAGESKGIEPNPQLKNELLRRFQAVSSPAKTDRTSWIVKVLSLRIPAYQALLAASVLILLTFFLQKNYFVQSPSTRYIPIVHTIHVREHSINSAPDISTAQPQKTRETTGSPTFLKKKGNPLRSAEEIPELYAAHVRATDLLLKKESVSGIGSNVLHDSLLFQLLVTVN